jgi:hypothetical protein
MRLNIGVKDPMRKEKKTTQILGRIYITPRICHVQNKAKHI